MENEIHNKNSPTTQEVPLEVLKNDPDKSVRASVARQGWFLEELKNDPEYVVRAAVAEQGTFLDELKDDPDEGVRIAVTKQGYALDQLKNDPYPYVRHEAQKMLNKSSGMTDWLNNIYHSVVNDFF